MIKSLKDLNKDLKIQICNCYEKRHDFDYLREKFNYLENNILLSILYSTGKYDKELNKLLCKTCIGNKKILIADEGKHIRSIDDVPREDENGNKIEPYYTSIIFLADNFDDSKLNELYIEEDINN